MKMTMDIKNREDALKFVEYINKYGYFSRGVHYVDIDGNRYRVEGIMKYFALRGFNI